jgi:Ca-activated chloride channel family protein
VSFAAPLVLLGLLVLPAPAVWYVLERRRRAGAAGAFVSAPLVASVAPRTPGIRRGVLAAIALAALAALILGAARPRYRTTVPVKAASVVLTNDVSDSMTSTDVKPTRLGAAQKAAITFTERVPAGIAVGSVKFARHPTLLQSPSTDHALARAAIMSLMPGGGGTAIGEAIETGLTAIKDAAKVDGKTPPGAIVLLSDGTSNVGVSPIQAAKLAKQEHVKIYTVAIGTASGTMQEVKAGKTVTIPAPVSPAQLQQTAEASGGTFYRAADLDRASAIYTRLAKQLGHKRVNKGLIAEFVGAGLVLLLLGGGLSLRWFGALA